MSNKKKKRPGIAGGKKEPVFLPIKNPATNKFEWAGKKVNDVNA